MDLEYGNVFRIKKDCAWERFSIQVLAYEVFEFNSSILNTISLQILTCINHCQYTFAIAWCELSNSYSCPIQKGICITTVHKTLDGIFDRYVVDKCLCLRELYKSLINQHSLCLENNIQDSITNLISLNDLKWVLHNGSFSL